MILKNKNLFIIAVIAVVNALGYGIILPILYSYSKRFGLSDFENGLLFSVFSLCQFIATPFIGRLSDEFGRKPLLIISLVGTALSFLIMAAAPSAIFLFIARALDGITAGNIPVASAVISDTTKPEERARGFGIIGASFGFGFIFGPAISAVTVGLGTWVPFVIAAFITTVAILLTVIILPETNVHKGIKKGGKIFDFAKLARALMDKNVGQTLLITLVYSFAFAMFIYVYQPFSVHVLGLSAQQISVNFVIFGIVGLIAQTILIPKITTRWGDRESLAGSLFTAIISFTALFFVKSLPVFIIISIFHALANAFVNPMLQSLLSKEADIKSQGEILGVNASYMSLGLIFGPIVGGALATLSVPSPFLAGSSLCAVCFYLALNILQKHRIKQLRL